MNTPDYALVESLRWTPDQGYYLTDRHLRRLAASARQLGFPFAATAVADRLRALAAHLPPAAHKVRLLLHADGSLAGAATPLAARPLPDPVRVHLAAAPVDSRDPLLYHKTTCRRVYDEALRAVPAGDDVLLWNERGEVTEASAANIVVDWDGAMVTPPVACGLLPGTLRAHLLERGEIGERVVPVGALPRCRAIYLINSVRQWRRALLAGTIPGGDRDRGASASRGHPPGPAR